MKHDVYPSHLKGEFEVPGSKSIAQRMAAAALLSSGETTIYQYPGGADCEAVVQVIQNLGAIVTRKGNDLHIRGGYPHAFRSGIKSARPEIHCGESGLASRMFVPIAALLDRTISITGEGTLLNRPFQTILDILPDLGVEVVSTNGFLPLSVKGPLKAGKCEIDGSISSQFLSGLLMALPCVDGESVITAKNLKSKPYVEMTLQVCRAFGVEITVVKSDQYKIRGPQRWISGQFVVPGDWSSAAFLLVAGALVAESHITLHNLDPVFVQADQAILQILQSAGVGVEVRGKSVTVRKSAIRAFECDCSSSPDLFPPLAALAAFADGVSTIHGVHRLVHKESNRAKALVEEFAKTNIRIVVRDDEMKIYPGHIRPATVSSHRDHRIAMACAILGLAGDKVSIAGAEAVKKSFPGFFEALSALGARVQ